MAYFPLLLASVGRVHHLKEVGAWRRFDDGAVELT